MTRRIVRHAADIRLPTVSAGGAFKSGRDNVGCKAGETHPRLTGHRNRWGGRDRPEVWTPLCSFAPTINVPSQSGASAQRCEGASSRLHDAMTTTIPVETSLHGGLRGTPAWGEALRWTEERAVSRLEGWSR